MWLGGGLAHRGPGSVPSLQKHKSTTRTGQRVLGAQRDGAGASSARHVASECDRPGSSVAASESHRRSPRVGTVWRGQGRRLLPVESQAWPLAREALAPRGPAQVAPLGWALPCLSGGPVAARGWDLSSRDTVCPGPECVPPCLWQGLSHLADQGHPQPCPLPLGYWWCPEGHLVPAPWQGCEEGAAGLPSPTSTAPRSRPATQALWLTGQGGAVRRDGCPQHRMLGPEGCDR